MAVWKTEDDRAVPSTGASCVHLSIPPGGSVWTPYMLHVSLEEHEGFCLLIFKGFEIYYLKWNLYLHEAASNLLILLI